MTENHPIYVHEALRWASSYLNKHSREEEIARRLLLHHTGWSRARLFAEMRSEISLGLYRAFQKDIELAAEGTPVQHITGSEIFCGWEYRVTPDVLIPRPETEELIEAITREIAASGLQPENVVDIGTGSGIIAITLHRLWASAGNAGGEGRQVHVTATERSPEALAVAKENAVRLGAADITFLEGDLTAPLLDKGVRANVIVSNPPYIPTGDRQELNENVADHEPDEALFAGDDGLQVYRRLAGELPDIIEVPGLIALEIGWNQGNDVKQLLLKIFPEADITVEKDMNGNERIVLARINDIS